ncbi:restriction endonuclease subunit S [Christiangramia salexigens]|uniref:Type I restriction modification DNA specificity domain-containing protein n=1 Tax=Christiangramia salexigens TaxID=1913577 RepID=A0A1L3J2K0_9FLAO|nr:restriction endonuclease subunit S [Christiangramia salexigens]APG59340.1 hypothetical protein LPB144_02450 [Christiangramia salexigens]
MSKQETDIGTCPAHWQVVKFSSVAELKHGYQFRTNDFTESGIKVFKITQIKSDGSIDLSSCSFIDESRLESFTNNIIKNGDILMALSGATIGKIGRFRSNEVVLQNYRVGNFIPLDEKIIMKDYFYYFLTTENTYYQIMANQNQSAQENVGKADIHNMLVFLPPFEEQKSIAEVLSSLDDKIDLLYRQNQTLEQMAETLYDAWFEESDFTSRVSDLIDLQNGYAFKSKSFQDLGEDRVLKIKNISGGIVDIETTDFVSHETVENLDEKFSISTGDILFAMTGAKIGKMGIIPKTDYKLWLNQRVGLFKEKYYGSRFLAYLHLKSDYGKDYIENTATGSAQPNISGTGIENCEFPAITEQEIVEYSNQLAPLYEKVIFNLGQIQKLDALRNTLLPKLMGGEISINTDG